MCYHCPAPTLSLRFRQKVKVKVAQSCPTLCDLMDYTVHGILQARILGWVAFPFSRGSSQPKHRTQVSRTAGGFFTSWATGKPSESESRSAVSNSLCLSSARKVWDLPGGPVAESTFPRLGAQVCFLVRELTPVCHVTHMHTHTHAHTHAHSPATGLPHKTYPNANLNVQPHVYTNFNSSDLFFKKEKNWVSTIILFFFLLLF